MKFFAIIAAAQLAAALPLAKDAEDTKACSGDMRMSHPVLTSTFLADQIQSNAHSRALGFRRFL